jgi:hypothetical protein
MKQVPKEQDKENPEAEFDSRGFKERTGPEVFEMICSAAISNANPKCSYDQLKGFRKVGKLMKDNIKAGEFVANKTEIDVIKNAIKGNPSWPNQEELENILDSILANLDGAELCS